MNRLIVIGSANADLVVPAARRPAGGETVLGGALTVHPGGKGANQAVAASRLGGQVSFIGRVGGDAHGVLLRDSLHSSGVDTTHLLTSATATGVAMITVTPDGENSILVAPGANGDLAPGDLDNASGLFVAGAVVVMQLEIPQAVVDRGVALARHSDARVILNAAPARPLPGPVLAAADPLIINETEAAFYLGAVGETMSPPGSVLAERLRALGARSVVVTLGPGGAFVAEAGGACQVPATPVGVSDTTGAGDSFVAAIAVELSRGAELSAAAGVAVEVAAVTVSRPGAQSSFPWRAELERPEG